MLRLALVNAGTQADTIGRVRGRLRGATISAVVDPDARRAAQLASQLGAPATAASIQDLHERHSEAFDAWAALTPAGWLLAPHENRPLETDPARWLTSGNSFQWAHPFRYLPSVLALEQSLNSGKLGAPGLVRIHHWQPAGHVRFAMLAQLDIACGMIDQPATTLFAQARPGPNIAPQSYLQVHLGFADDRMAMIDCATSLAGQQEYCSLSVIGSTGAAYADDHHNMQLLFGGPRPLALRTSQGDRALLDALQEFVDATAQGRPPQCGAAQWRRVQTLWDSVEQSVSTGQAVTLKGPIS